jgi:hypothetical protein
MSERNFKSFVFLSLILALCGSCDQRPEEPIIPQVLSPNEERSGCQVSSPPEEFHFSRFYEKYCDAYGIPIISSGEVENRALQQAYYIINNMLAPVPEVRQQLVSRGYYVAVIGLTEELTTLPEYRHMDSVYWNWRAKALGGSKRVKITSAAEENMLCFRRDRYYLENILIHEFAHTIHLAGLGSDYNKFNRELKSLYQSALDEGLWELTYAADNHLEYWAEGVQSYFNTNLESNPANGVHNQVNTREELAEYDPALYAFIADFFDDFEWTPTCPKLEVISEMGEE